MLGTATLTNFNVLTRRFLIARCTENDYDGGWRDKIARSCIGKSPIESARDSRTLERPRGSYPIWNIGYDKAVGATKAASAYYGQQAKTETISQQCLTIFASLGVRNMDPLLCTR